MSDSSPPIIEEHKKLLKVIAKAEATQARGDGYSDGWVNLRHGGLVSAMKSNGWLPLKNLANALEQSGLIECNGDSQVRLTESGQNELNHFSASSKVETKGIVQPFDYFFVDAVELREILARDSNELAIGHANGCHKTVLVLSGGCVEALLLHFLGKQNPTKVSSAKAASKKYPKDLNRWDLYDLVNTAVELELLSSGAGKLSDSLRQFRNLIHPGYEVREGLKVDECEANIAYEVLKLIRRDLEAFSKK